MTRILRQRAPRNMNDAERVVSVLGGGALAVYGLGRRSPAGIVAAIAGAALVQRGWSGRCVLYRALGVNTAPKASYSPTARGSYRDGIRVQKSITINRPRDFLYSHWRRFDNLPVFMSHVEAVDVEVLDPTRSHWRVTGPAGTSVEWDAVVHKDIENELISWRSVEDADIENAGTVQFRAAPGGRGTEIHVILVYRPPSGRMGAWFAKLFGENPDEQIEEDLSRFKQLMEAGEIATAERQPSLRQRGAGEGVTGKSSRKEGQVEIAETSSTARA